MLKKIHKLRDEIYRWTRQPGAELTRKQRAVRYWFDLIRHCFAELKYDKAGQMAAALTYHTLFSLLPTIVLMLVVLQAFVGPAKQEEVKQLAVNWLLKPITQEVEETSNPPTVIEDGESAVDSRPDTDREEVIAATERRQEFEEARKAIEDQIQSVMDSLSKVSFGGIGIIGVLIFIYGATGLLTTIEKSFNHIYNAPRMRPIYLRFPLYFTVIVLGPMVVLAGQVGQDWFIDQLQGGWTNWLAGPMVVLSPLITLLVVIGAVFKWMPNTRVEFRASLIGAVVTAVLWLLAIEGLKLFVAKSATSSIYGALFLLPLFLLWLWVTWVIILFGLEVAYAVQAMKGRRFKHLAANRDEMVIDPTWLLPLITEVAARFDEGQPATVEKLADRLNVSQRVTQHMLNTLERAEMVHRVGGDDEKAAGYVLARPADRFNAADVLAVGDKMVSDIRKGDTPAWNLVGRLRDQWRQLAESTKIEDLARGNQSKE